MKPLITLGVGILLFSCSRDNITTADSYFIDRNVYIANFNVNTPLEKDERALKDLEKKLNLIIGQIEVDGFDAPPKINLETLIQELGFGILDGLEFKNKKEELVVTTKEILIKYAKESGTLPTDTQRLAQDENFYSTAFESDVFVKKYFELPTQTGTKHQNSYSFVGLTAQDTGPFIPHRVFVYLEKDDLVFIVSADISQLIHEIEFCTATWERFNDQKNEAWKNYRISGNEDMYKVIQNLESKSEEEFILCFTNEFKRKPEYQKVIEVAQSIENRLLKAERTKQITSK